QFPVDLYDAVHSMMIVLENGGFSRGGLNFDAKVRRESVCMEDIFIGHIGGMDTFARGLEIAYRILSDGKIAQKRDQRYTSFDKGDGARFEAGELSLVDLYQLAGNNPEPELVSGRQEWYENIINQYILTCK
ncbi:MAG: xylose isomerase, partial [Pseudomonadales bacterium]|nr:xylose isomerase [Pseudomonadales bacterium]